MVTQEELEAFRQELIASDERTLERVEQLEREREIIALKDCADLVALVDTLMDMNVGTELWWFRVLTPILEELSEYYNEGEANKAEEEERDVCYYIISMLNRLDPKWYEGGWYTRPYTNTGYSICVALGELKKALRSGREININKQELVEWGLAFLRGEASLYGVAIKLNTEEFCTELVKKLYRKFPEKVKEWGI